MVNIGWYGTGVEPVPVSGRTGGTMFSGLMPAMVTPFDERGEVDLEAAEAVVERFIEAG